MGAPAVAVIVAKEKRVVEAFRGARATSRDSAVRPTDIGVPDHFALRRLRQRAVLREGEPGKFYLDEASWEALQATRRRIGLAMLTIVLFAALYFLLVRPR